MTEQETPPIESARGPLRIAPIGDTDPALVAELWRRCGLVVPHNPPLADIAFSADREGSDILLGFLGDEIVASVMVGHDGHRGWLYYVAVDPDRQASGFGREMVRAAEDWLRQRGVRKAQLMVREANQRVIGFYDRLGYERSPVVVMQRWLHADDGA